MQNTITLFHWVLALQTSWKSRKKTSPKGFSASKCDVGNWIFSKSWRILGDFWGILVGFFGTSLAILLEFFRIFLEIFWIFGGNFLVGFFLEEFFGRYFLGGFFWEEFFGRNYLVEINKELMFLSRFCGNFVSMEKKEGRRKNF